MKEKLYKMIKQMNPKTNISVLPKSAQSAKQISTTGFSMVEMLIYVGILSFVFIFVVVSILYVGDSYKKLKAERVFAASAETSFDQMLRRIREAGQVDPSSTLGSHPGVLILQPGNFTFFLDNGELKFQEGTSLIGSISDPNVSVTNLVFRRIMTSGSEGVKIDMTLQTSIGESVLEREFSGTAVLRGSY